MNRIGTRRRNSDLDAIDLIFFSQAPNVVRWRIALVVMVVLGFFLCSGLSVILTFLRFRFGTGSVGWFLLSILSTGLFATLARRECFAPHELSVIPTFSSMVPGEPLNESSGTAVCRNYLTLEKVANERGIKPLSSFGQYFNFRVRIKWHQAEDGLDACQDLISVIRSGAASVENSEEVVRELEQFVGRLRIAAENGVSFAMCISLDGIASRDIGASGSYF